MPKDFGAVVKLTRENKGLSQNQLAGLANLTGDFISKLERGEENYRNPTIDTIEAIAKALEVHPANLLYGEDLLKYAALKRLATMPDKPSNAHEAPDYEPFDIPVVGLAKAGKEGFFDDAGFPVGEGFKKIHRPDFVKDPTAYGLLIDGDSMSPMIEKGWTVVCSPKEQIVNGDLAVARLTSGEVMLKKILIQKDLFILSSINPQYQPIAVKKRDLEFLHRVVMIKPK